MMPRGWLAPTLAVMLFAWVPGAKADDKDSWEDYRFLLGDWSGEGKGAPGQGKGRFSFALDLQGKILVRKHKAETAATGDKPAATHEDLLVIHRAPGGKGVRAVYFDSEDHVIHYTASFSADKQTLTFLSDAAADQPRFRLSYTKQKDVSLAVKFEIAPPGKPDAFKIYVEGTAAREGKPAAAPK
jgi:hypothetical protein